MPDAADYVEWFSGGDVLDWRRALDAVFALPPDEREAALRVIRPIYESRLTPQFHAVPWGVSLHEPDAFSHGLRERTRADPGLHQDIRD